MNTFFTRLISVGTAIVLTACAGIEGPQQRILPLDHGPRAQATPWQNQQRLMHAEQHPKVERQEPTLKPDA